MKVKDIIKKYRMCSNADVFLQTADGQLAKLETEEIREERPHILMESTVNSFDIIDKVLTIYIKGGK